MIRRSLALAVAVAVAACPAAAGAAEVTVFAAASLADALSELGRGFEATTKGHVVFDFGASSDLARQVLAGAPADVFFSADRAQVDRLEKAGLVRAAGRIDVLANTLVVIVPAASPLRLRGPSDLASLPRIALADPEAVPAGVYARTWLESVGLWARLRGRVVPTLDVRAARAAVESENVPAGIVYRTDAALSPRVRVAFEVPRETGPKVLYVLAPLATSRSPLTRPLVQALTSPAAAHVYARYGFTVLLPR